MITDLTASCVMCSNTSDLNTTMTVKHGDASFTIKICNKCEDTSPKVIREKLADKIKQLEEFMAQAEKLGVKIQQPTSSAPVAMPSEQRTHKTDEHGRFKPTTISKEMQDVKNEAGRIMALPKVVKTDAGNTTYRINKFSDKDLQDKFKRTARTITNNNQKLQMCVVCNGNGVVDTPGSDGTTEIRCNVCNGDGILAPGMIQPQQQSTVKGTVSNTVRSGVPAGMKSLPIKKK